MLNHADVSFGLAERHPDVAVIEVLQKPHTQNQLLLRFQQRHRPARTLVLEPYLGRLLDPIRARTFGELRLKRDLALVPPVEADNCVMCDRKKPRYERSSALAVPS